MEKEHIDYHSTRATRELDLGLIAKSLPAARAHLRLASLHMERLRELTGSRLNKRPVLTM
jgi:hypothetical protein